MRKLRSALIVAAVHSIERSLEFVIGVIEYDSNTDLFKWSCKTAYSKALSVKVFGRGYEGIEGDKEILLKSTIE